ncbi:MAG: hypothetical protein ACI8RD_010426 [Bacillariaceae sp.]|jgi:hypothetical protein
MIVIYLNRVATDGKKHITSSEKRIIGVIIWLTEFTQ